MMGEFFCYESYDAIRYKGRLKFLCQAAELVRNVYKRDINTVIYYLSLSHLFVTNVTSLRNCDVKECKRLL